MIIKDSIAFGPPDKNGIRGHADHYFIRISDSPFKNGKPTKGESPCFIGTIYS